jgi:hypothetical protein
MNRLKIAIRKMKKPNAARRMLVIIGLAARGLGDALRAWRLS